MQYTLNTLIASSPVWTSALVVQGYQRVNISFNIGSQDFDSSPVISTFSGVLTLQRQLSGDTIWRDVQEWAVLAADALDANIESVTDKPEPESCHYRFGVKEAEWYSVGFGYVRLGTS